MLDWIAKRLKEPAPPPRPQDLRIAGIYTVCDRLGLPKSWNHDLYGKRIAVPMESGRVAIYTYADYEHASGVDWGWHIFHFRRYALPDEVLDMPVYS